MDLSIMNKQVGDVSVVALKGRIVLGEGSSSLSARIKSLLGDGKKKIVLKMENVTYIDSAGLGILVGAHVSAKNQSTVLYLSDLGNKAREVVEVTRLLTVFNVFATEVQAISEFRAVALAVAAKAN